MIWTGIGVNVPFGLVTEWDSDWMGRFHAIKSEVKTININPSAAWKATLALRRRRRELPVVRRRADELGQLQRGRIRCRQARRRARGAAAAGCGGLAPPGGLRGGAKVSGDTWSWGWNVGAMVELQKTQTRVGLTYRSG